MKTVRVVGITGGVGSGKSTISKLLEERFGAYIISTDKVAHDLMEKGGISFNLIVEYFGRSILDDNGNIDRKKLGAVVYNNKAQLEKLNSFTHPFVLKEVQRLIKEKARVNYKLICIETALPIEAKLDKMCDMIWYIYTPEDVRVSRLKKSRNYSDEKIRAIMDKQLSDKEYRKHSTHVVLNVEDKDQIINQIDEILEDTKEEKL